MLLQPVERKACHEARSAPRFQRRQRILLPQSRCNWWYSCRPSIQMQVRNCGRSGRRNRSRSSPQPCRPLTGSTPVISVRARPCRRARWTAADPPDRRHPPEGSARTWFIRATRLKWGLTATSTGTSADDGSRKGLAQVLRPRPSEKVLERAGEEVACLGAGACRTASGAIFPAAKRRIKARQEASRGAARRRGGCCCRGPGPLAGKGSEAQPPTSVLRIGRPGAGAAPGESSFRPGPVSQACSFPMFS